MHERVIVMHLTSLKTRMCLHNYYAFDCLEKRCVLNAWNKYRIRFLEKREHLYIRHCIYFEVKCLFMHYCIKLSEK